MKDVYDVYVLLLSKATDPEILKEALEATFINRNTPTGSIAVIFTEEYVSDKKLNVMWQSFLKKIKAPLNLSFDQVMQRIKVDIISYL